METNKLVVVSIFLFVTALNVSLNIVYFVSKNSKIQKRSRLAMIILLFLESWLIVFGGIVQYNVNIMLSLSLFVLYGLLTVLYYAMLDNIEPWGVQRLFIVNILFLVAAGTAISMEIRNFLRQRQN